MPLKSPDRSALYPPGVSFRSPVRSTVRPAIAIGNDPLFHDDIEKFVRAIAGGAQSVAVYARETAEAELNEKLAKLERYERRAFSRRKQALRTPERGCPQLPTVRGLPPAAALTLWHGKQTTVASKALDFVKWSAAVFRA
jgi:hypothetical protein